MKLGISSYSLFHKLTRAEMSIFDVIDWAKARDCAHLELVPHGLPLLKDDGTIDYQYVGSIRDKAASVGLPLSVFSLNACVIRPTEAERQAELARIRMYMDMAHFLGMKKMRHDTCSGQQPTGDNSPEQFERDFPVIVQSVQEVADYAASLGMQTTLENHGLYVNGADRLIRIIKAANRPNVGLTMDVGNYLCVEDDVEYAVAKSVQYADMIHLKDFYIRKRPCMVPQESLYAGDGTTPSLRYVGSVSGNRLLRGAILGQGDIDIWKVLEIIKKAGYTQEISIEFEGMEDCATATGICLDTARYIWNRV